MTMKEALIFGTGTLLRAGIEDARIDAWYLLEHVTGASRTAYYTEPDMPLSQRQKDRYKGLIEKRGEHVPLQRLTGEQEFMGLTFSVDGNVLIPRADTETLVCEALSALDKCPEVSGKIRALDIGTGSGCVILSIIYHAAKKGIDVEGVGTDISDKAIERAVSNAKDLKIPAVFFKSDLFENVEGKFSLIVCNPPYIRTGEIDGLMEEVRRFDPRRALDGGEDGLYFYRKIIPNAGRYLEDNAMLLFETGFDQAESVAGLMREAGYSDIRIQRDLAGKNRVAAGVYKSGRSVWFYMDLERKVQDA